MRPKNYGKIGSATLPNEIRRIWYTKDVEPEPCEPLEIFVETQTNPDELEIAELIQKMLDLDPIEEHNLMLLLEHIVCGARVSSIAQEDGLYRETVNHRLRKTLRRLRSRYLKISGETDEEFQFRYRRNLKLLDKRGEFYGVLW